MPRNIEIDLTLIVIEVEENIVDITHDEVLEAVLLAELDEFLRGFASGNDWIAGSSGSCDIITTRHYHLKIEVHIASSAPLRIIVSEIISGAFFD